MPASALPDLASAAIGLMGLVISLIGIALLRPADPLDDHRGAQQEDQNAGLDPRASNR